MTEFALTDERRRQLAALLDDEQRFAARYPKVAEYLESAPRLAGTGNPERDAAFDVRLLHYLTGGRSTSGNPYWDIVGPSVSVVANRRQVDGGRPEGSSRLAFAATILQAAYAYAIPAPDTARWAARLCGARRVVEVGAGRGYWARELTRCGARVAAFDSRPPGDTVNASFPSHAGQRDLWHEVENVERMAADAPGPDDVLFLCWPPGWGNTMSSETLAAFEANGGQRLLYVGEAKGGKTGDDAFFDALAARWHPAERDPDFVSWWNNRDAAEWWIRRI
jgi:hypothetical protein